MISHASNRARWQALVQPDSSSTERRSLHDERFSQRRKPSASPWPRQWCVTCKCSTASATARPVRLIPAMFGIFGHGNVCGMGQALEECGRELPYYQPCNEQSMVHTAIGFAKANLRLATLACTSSIGPGSTNMITGAAAATINRLPVLLFPSDYYATRHQGPVLQQLEHPVSADVSVNDCFRPVSRFFDRITRPEQLLTAPAGGDARADRSGRDGHGHDCACRRTSRHTHSTIRRASSRSTPGGSSGACPIRTGLAEAIALLKEARRPVIIAGGGVHYSEAWQELQDLAEGLGIPVAETFAGKGALRNASPLALGGHGLEGNRSGRHDRQPGRPGDCCRHAPDRLRHRLAVVLQQPPGAFHQHQRVPVTMRTSRAPCRSPPTPARLCASLTKRARAAGIQPRPDYLERIAHGPAGLGRKDGARGLHAPRRRGDEPGRADPRDRTRRPARATRSSPPRAARRATCSSSGIPPAAGPATWSLASRAWATRSRRAWAFGWLSPRVRSIVLIGDGTYLMNPTELMTALQEDLKITVVIAENHGYQCIRRLQMWRTGVSFGNEFRRRDPESNRLEGDYVPIDLAKNAESFGARTWHVETPEQLRSALQAAKAERATCVIVAETEKSRFLPGGGVWWDVAPAEVSQDPDHAETACRVRTGSKPTATVPLLIQYGTPACRAAFRAFAYHSSSSRNRAARRAVRLVMRLAVFVEGVLHVRHGKKRRDARRAQLAQHRPQLHRGRTPP